MMKIKYGFALILSLCFGFSILTTGHQSNISSTNTKYIIVGAARMNQYLPLLKGKRVSILTNNTALVNGELLVDTLLKRGINIVKIFSPEHGFRGIANAGATIENSVDPKTGIPIISLFGKHNKPTPEDLSGVDIMVYDIQDVGVHFYTYISTMQLFMEAAADNHKPFIILDRPNPNGFYVDGPVLDKKFKSLVGMQQVPVVYGMTIGEYAKMIIGQQWLSDPTLKPELTVIKCLNYTHDSLYQLPTKPSPNLPNMTSVYLYPSLCFFEGTACSVGRGTKYPFQLFGSPYFPDNLYSFTPKPELGATDPKLEGQKCYGFLVATNENEALKEMDGRLQLKWIIQAYKLYPDKEKFFLDHHFDLLAGTDGLRKEIQEGWSEEKIRASWEPGLKKFEAIRKKYLLYPDFTH